MSALSISSAKGHCKTEKKNTKPARVYIAPFGQRTTATRPLFWEKGHGPGREVPKNCSRSGGTSGEGRTPSSTLSRGTGWTAAESAGRGTGGMAGKAGGGRGTVGAEASHRGFWRENCGTLIH